MEANATELELLRLENDTLRRKLAGLEESMSSMEERYGKSVEQLSTSLELAPSGEESGDAFEPALENLRGLLGKIEAAKSEAMQFHEIGKEQLADDVQHLYRLLKRARAERAQMAFRVEDLEMQLALEKRRAAELAITVEAGEKAFLQVHRRDRELAEKRIRKAEEKAVRCEAEIEALFAWVQTRQQALVATSDALTYKIKSTEAESKKVAEAAAADAANVVDELRADLAAVVAAR